MTGILFQHRYAAGHLTATFLRDLKTELFIRVYH